jgi:hypothetical protein
MRLLSNLLAVLILALMLPALARPPRRSAPPGATIH